MSIREYLKANPPTIQKGLEPNKCGLCNGNHPTTALYMCGTCMGGLADYMGGGEVADRLRMGREPGTYSPKTAPVTSHSAPNSNRNAIIREQGGTGSLPPSPRTVRAQEGPRSAFDKMAAARREEPATHSNTNASRAHSRPMPR